MAKVLMAIPTDGGIHENVAVVAAHLAKYKDIVFMAARGRPVDYVRNSIIQQFLRLADYTHLFFLDSDTEPPVDCVEKLLSLNTKIASGCYPVVMQSGLRWALANKHKDGHYRLLERIDKEPFEVDAGGAGCLLIRRDVFDAVSWPWFKWINNEDGSQESEDMHFFRKCNQAGIRIKVHPDVICNHHKEVNITTLIKLQQKNERQ